MTSEASELLRRRFPCDPSAPQSAREATRALAALGALGDDATLVVSELVTNAVRHSGSSARDELELTIALSASLLTISVSDVGRSANRPALRPKDATPGGLGLHIVDAVADRWGVDSDSGIRVWAEIPRREGSAVR